MDRSVVGATTVRIGSVVAVCARCGSDQFARRRRPRSRYSDSYVCLSCEREATHAELMQQIATKVSQQAQRVLDELAAARALRKR